MKKMKNLKMFAIAIMAFAVMAIGVHADSYNGLTCTESTFSDQCTVSTTGGTLTGNVAAGKKITIIGDGKTIILGSLTLEKNSTLEIKGAYVELGANTVTVKSGATLTITESPKEVSGNHAALLIKSSSAKIVVDGGTLNVTGNKSYSAIVVNGSGVGSKIDLDDATLNINDNRGNGMQGANSLTLTAKDSTINVKNNTSNGLGATLKLENTTVNASGNGYAGVIFGSGSSIDEDSHVNAKGNLTAGDDIAKQKADILLDNGDAAATDRKATINVEGYIDADSIAPTKVTWTSGDAGKVSTGELVVTGNNVKIGKTIDVCSNISGHLVLSCGASDANTVSIVAANGEYAVVTIGDEAQLYANTTEEITLDKAYDNLVVTTNASMKKLTVVSGTSVINKTGDDLVVYEVGADRPIVVPAAEAGKDPVAVTVGTKAPEEGTPGEGQPGTEGEGSGNQGPTDNVKNPETNDNILVYAGLGLISLATVTFTTRKRED